MDEDQGKELEQELKEDIKTNPHYIALEKLYNEEKEKNAKLKKENDSIKTTNAELLLRVNVEKPSDKELFKGFGKY